ncbi:MAG TPA: hypothetical protein VEH84_01615 [Alphaproteobacteria bacterium]|nr:hypothetical protein [Alphaproteobacteria bacterium]
MSPSRPAFSAQEALTALFKDRAKIAAAFLVPVALAAAVSTLPTPKYEAGASLLVLFGREYVYRPEVGDTMPDSAALDRDRILRSEIEILESGDLLAAVVRKADPAVLYPKLAELPAAAREAEAVKAFRAAFTAKPQPDSNVIQLGFRHPEAALSADVLNMLIDDYLERRRAIYATRRGDFLKEQAEGFATRLAAVERDLERFKSESGIFDFDTQRRLLLEQRTALQADLRDAENRAAEARERLAAMQASLSRTGATVTLQTESGRDLATDNARTKLLELRLRERELLSKYHETSRTVADVRREIAQVEAFLGEQGGQGGATVRTGRNPVHETLQTGAATAESEMRSLEVRVIALEQQAADLDAELAALDARERDYRILVRERAQLEESYRAIAAKTDEARILDELDRQNRANVRVVQPARVPAEAESPRRLILAGGVLAGLILALATACLADLFRRGFLAPGRLERAVGLPVLAAIPHRAAG